MENFKSKFTFTGYNNVRRRSNRSSISRHRSSLSGYRHGYFRITRTIGFFIGRKQRHYEILDKYIFSKLAELPIITTDTFPTTLLGYYNDLIPVNHYRYPDAVLHMQKENQTERLDILIEKYRKKIIQMNNNASEKWAIIKRIVRDKGSEFGYGNTNEVTLISIQSSLNGVLSQLKDIDDIRDWVVKNPQTVTMVSDSNAVDCLNAIIQDEELLECVEDIKQKDKELLELIEKIMEKASSFSQLINDEDYDVDAKCCPTILTILKRTFRF